MHIFAAVVTVGLVVLIYVCIQDYTRG